jgi:hypothetical protein
MMKQKRDLMVWKVQMTRALKDEFDWEKGIHEKK